VGCTRVGDLATRPRGTILLLRIGNTDMQSLDDALKSIHDIILNR